MNGLVGGAALGRRLLRSWLALGGLSLGFRRLGGRSLLGGRGLLGWSLLGRSLFGRSLLRGSPASAGAVPPWEASAGAGGAFLTERLEPAGRSVVRCCTSSWVRFFSRFDRRWRRRFNCLSLSLMSSPWTA